MHQFKLALLVLALAFASFRSGQRVHVARTEFAPAAFDMSRFPAEYNGRRWVRLTGRLAAEAMVVRPSGHKAHEGKQLAYAYVPVVPAEWAAGDPIHALITIGPLPAAAIESAVAQRANAGTGTVSGLVGPGLDREKIFGGGTRFGSPFIWVNEGDGPPTVRSAALLFGGFFAAFVSSLWLLIRRWRTRHDADLP